MPLPRKTVCPQTESRNNDLRVQIAADRKAGGLPPSSKSGAAAQINSATPLMFSASSADKKAVLRAPPCLSVDQLVLFSTTFKREELPDEQTDTTVIPEICDKHTRKNDKLSHLPAFHRPSRRERQRQHNRP